jgi:hypothetical protein
MSNFRKVVLVLLLLAAGQTIALAWGAWAHYRINRSAVFTLPDSMRLFYYNHIDYITEQAVMPDTRIYGTRDKDEAYRHYIDLELIPGGIAGMPISYEEAHKKYPDSLLRKTGILPWHVNELIVKLTRAFKNLNKPEILLFSGDIAHYIGDAHTPLHTSENHDGQLTGQKGIHSMWESEMPEKFSASYSFHTGNATYINEPLQAIFKTIAHSSELAAVVLNTEKQLSTGNPDLKKFVINPGGDTVKNRFRQSKHTSEYLVRYNALLRSMIQDQLKAAVKMVGDIWYTAWVDAGRPDLSKLDDPSLTKRNSVFYQQDYASWKKGLLTGVRAAPEF